MGIVIGGDYLEIRWLVGWMAVIIYSRGRRSISEGSMLIGWKIGFQFLVDLD